MPVPIRIRIADVLCGGDSHRANKKAFEDKEGGNRLDGLDGRYKTSPETTLLDARLTCYSDCVDLTDPDLPDVKTLRARINASAKTIQLADGGSLAAAKREATSNLTVTEREILEGTFKGKRYVVFAMRESIRC